MGDIDYEQTITNLESAMDGSALYIKFLALASIGRLKEGWKSLFDAQCSDTAPPDIASPMRRFPKRHLFIMQPPPATVYVHQTGGFGDNFCLIRYLPQLSFRGYNVIFEPKITMEGVVRESFPWMHVTHEPQMFDYHLPVSLLPWVFGTDIDSIPWPGPYIKANRNLVDIYSGCRGKIGICWRSGLATQPQTKSVPFELLKPILEKNPERFVALQQGTFREENDFISDVLPRDRWILWSDTAALIANLDLVISIDTGVAHLAGAMGKPCWVMMHRGLTSWQMLADVPGAPWQTRSPWYPTMEVIRHRRLNEWGDVIEAIAGRL